MKVCVPKRQSSSTRRICPLHVGLPSDRCGLVATTTEVKEGHKVPIRGQSPTLGSAQKIAGSVLRGEKCACRRLQHTFWYRHCGGDCSQAVLSPAFLRSPLFRLFRRPRPQRIPFPNLGPEISGGTRTSGTFSSTPRRGRFTGQSKLILTIPMSANVKMAVVFH